MGTDGSRGPMKWMALLGLFALVAAWGVGTYLLVTERPNWPVWGALPASYIWVGAGAVVGTLLFVESIRWVYHRQGLTQR